MPTATQINVFAAAYDLLGRLYLGGPRAISREQLSPLDPLLEALGTVDPAWPGQVDTLLRVRSEQDLERAQEEYLQCVALPVPGRYVPPYASVYLDGGVLWGASTFDVLRRYEAEGLGWNRLRPGPGGTPLAPDHVGVEMAFLAVVTSRTPTRRKAPDQAKRIESFLRDHVVRWLPKFRESLQSADQDRLLRGWTEWAVAVAEADLQLRSADVHFGD
jgi:TorA maturation chaperone TorD